MRLNLSLGMNPIIVKELRSRMREARAFVTLTGVLLILGSVSYLIYRMVLASTVYTPTPVSPQIGQTLFLALAFLELLMVCSIAPAVTAGAISGEQEKLTYEMLMATPLRPASILWGKLVSALSYVFLLIFAAVPMASLIFIFGGVSLRDMAKAMIILIVVAITFGVFGLFMSVLFKRTSRATVLSYLVVGLLLFGTIFVYMALGVIRQSEPPRWILVPNPLSAMISALAPSLALQNSMLSSFYYWGMNFGGGISALGGQTISQTSIPRPIYHYSLPLFAGVALVFYLLSTRLVRTNRRWRLNWKEAVIALVLLASFGGATGLAFTTTADRYENVSIFQPVAPQPVLFGQGVAVERAVEVQPAPLVEVPATPTPTPAPIPTPTPFDALTNGEIYAAVIRQLYFSDYFGGNPPESPVLYILSQTDDSTGDPQEGVSDSQPIADALQEAITAELWDLSAQVHWVGSREEVPAEKGGHLAAGEVIIVLGNLHMQGGGKGTVSASISERDMGGTGRTYRIEYIDGTWKVTGDTGFIWEQ
jgi:ABC-2 type transport system permease protein